METVFSPTVLAKAPEVDYRFLTEAAKLDPLSFEFDELYKATKGNRDRLELELAAKKHEYEMAEIEARRDATLAIGAQKKATEVKDTQAKLVEAERKKKELSDLKVAKIQEQFRKNYPTAGSIFTQSFDFVDDTLENDVKSVQDAYNRIIELDPTQATEQELNKSIRDFEIQMAKPGVNRAVKDYQFLKSMDGKTDYIGELVSYGMEEFMRNGFITNRDGRFYKITGDEEIRVNTFVKAQAANAFDINKGVEKVVGGTADVTRRNLKPNGIELAVRNVLEDPIVGRTVVKMAIRDGEEPERAARILIEKAISGVKLVEPGEVRKDSRSNSSNNGGTGDLTPDQGRAKKAVNEKFQKEGIELDGNISGQAYVAIDKAFTRNPKLVKTRPNGTVFLDDPDVGGVSVKKIGSSSPESSSEAPLEINGAVKAQFTNLGIRISEIKGPLEKYLKESGSSSKDLTGVTFTKADEKGRAGQYKLTFIFKGGKTKKIYYSKSNIPKTWKIPK